MEVISITPRGYCKGVVRAIDLVRHAVSDPRVPKPIYVFGMIVHNRHVVDELTSWGVISLESATTSWQDILMGIDSGTVVVTAHGAAPALKESIKAKRLHLIDATCEDVAATQKTIEQHLESGYRVLYIGKRGHPETEGVLAIDRRITLVESLPDLAYLFAEKSPIFVANQTTLSFRDLQRIHDRIRTCFPDAIVSNEICRATTSRQEALIQANVNVDLCYIVGDPRSNNTQSLVRLSREATNTRTILIESAADLRREDLFNVRRVSVSAGASTPPTIVNAVLEALRGFAEPLE